MDRIFINLKKKLTSGAILTRSWGYIHVYDLYSQTSLLVYISGEHLQDHSGSLVCNLNCLQFELSHFSGILTMKVNEQWVPCVCSSTYSFFPILLKLYMCYGQTCMWFGYNPQIIFRLFLQFNLVIFRAF